MNRIFQRRDVDAGLLQGRNAIRGGDRDNQERIHSRARTEPVVPAGKLAERAHAKLRKPMADFLRQRTEVRDHHLRFAGESCAQLFVLGGDSHWASVEMALASKDAVPKPNSSAPRIAASTISRANFRPPSTRRESRERRPARTSVS